MSYASILTAITAPPVVVPINGQDVILAQGKTPDEQGLLTQLMCRPSSSCAANFLKAQANDLVIVSGDLGLDEGNNLPVILIRSIVKGYGDQFLNEVAVTGRLGGSAKAAEKSLAESIAVDRGDGSDEPYWFRIRCFGANQTQLEALEKGTLVTATGILEMRRSAKDEPYAEVKVRKLIAHTRGGYNAAAGKEAAGYSQADFAGDDGSLPALPANWA